MRIESVFLLALMLFVPLTPLVQPTEAVSARSQPCGGTISVASTLQGKRSPQLDS